MLKALVSVEGATLAYVIAAGNPVPLRGGFVCYFRRNRSHLWFWHERVRTNLLLARHGLHMVSEVPNVMPNEVGLASA